MIGSRKTSPLSGKFLVRNRILYFLLIFTNYLFKIKILKKSKQSPRLNYFNAALICNISHLGDVVIATSIIPIIKKNYPNAKIGFLVGSWAKQIIEHNPQVDWIHTFDHWKLNRSSKNLFEKIKQYYFSRKKALSEIRSIHYDVAIDLYYYFPNSIPLIWKANIPIRTGYSSGGFKNLLTHSLDWKEKNQPVAQYHIDLLEFTFSKKLDVEKLRPSLKVSYEDLNYLLKKLKVCGFEANAYIVFHIGSGASIKEWPLTKWSQLINLFKDQKYTILFTGAGARENINIQKAIEGFSNCLNLCNQFNWQEFVSAVYLADLVICADSVIAHIASAFDKPCVIIGHGITNVFQWRPPSDKNMFISYPTPCSPCYLSKGCLEMECVQNIDVYKVYEASLNLL
ncbi:MAG: glycosyltransferase family 9 protein [Deltaproteobacteria bacterium]|nr:glycosyltransferase family 9 protein [Deltaproteobacteria bacterium]